MHGTLPAMWWAPHATEGTGSSMWAAVHVHSGNILCLLSTSVYFTMGLGKYTFVPNSRIYSEIFAECFLAHFKLLLRLVFCRIAHAYGNINHPHRGLYEDEQGAVFQKRPSWVAFPVQIDLSPVLQASQRPLQAPEV